MGDGLAVVAVDDGAIIRVRMPRLEFVTSQFLSRFSIRILFKEKIRSLGRLPGIILPPKNSVFRQ
jgi:hypothetical protein